MFDFYREALLTPTSHQDNFSIQCKYCVKQKNFEKHENIIEGIISSSNT